MRARAERAEVTVEQIVRELKLIGFSDAAAAVAEVWQTVNGALRVKLHDSGPADGSQYAPVG
jgi:hypothetical protein